MTVLFNPRGLVERRRQLRRNQTKAEAVLWSELRGGALGVRFRRQFGVDGYIVDFYCPRARLVIEVDGETHSTPKELAYDAERQSCITSLGLRVLRFTNQEVLEDMERVLEVVRDSLEITPPLTPPS